MSVEPFGFYVATIVSRIFSCEWMLTGLFVIAIIVVGVSCILFDLVLFFLGNRRSLCKTVVSFIKKVILFFYSKSLKEYKEYFTLSKFVAGVLFVASVVVTIYLNTESISKANGAVCRFVEMHSIESVAKVFDDKLNIAVYRLSGDKYDENYNKIMKSFGGSNAYGVNRMKGVLNENLRDYDVFIGGLAIGEDSKEVRLTVACGHDVFPENLVSKDFINNDVKNLVNRCVETLAFKEIVDLASYWLKGENTYHDEHLIHVFRWIAKNPNSAGVSDLIVFESQFIDALCVYFESLDAKEDEKVRLLDSGVETLRLLRSKILNMPFTDEFRKFHTNNINLLLVNFYIARFNLQINSKEIVDAFDKLLESSFPSSITYTNLSAVDYLCYHSRLVDNLLAKCSGVVFDSSMIYSQLSAIINSNSSCQNTWEDTQVLSQLIDHYLDNYDGNLDVIFNSISLLGELRTRKEIAAGYVDTLRLKLKKFISKTYSEDMSYKRISKFFNLASSSIRINSVDRVEKFNKFHNIFIDSVERDDDGASTLWLVHFAEISRIVSDEFTYNNSLVDATYRIYESAMTESNALRMSRYKAHILCSQFACTMFMKTSARIHLDKIEKISRVVLNEFPDKKRLSQLYFLEMYVRLHRKFKLKKFADEMAWVYRDIMSGDAKDNFKAAAGCLVIRNMVTNN